MNLEISKEGFLRCIRTGYNSIDQAIDEYIHNSITAIKKKKEQNGKIKINIYQDINNHWNFSIQDNGKGFSRNELSNLIGNICKIKSRDSTDSGGFTVGLFGGLAYLDFTKIVFIL